MDDTEVVIAGAGIIGLSLALDLASHGLRVTVLERGCAMTEASWAAGGMLAANDPENPPALAEFARYSLALYPNYLAQIEKLSGRKVPIRTTQTLQAVEPGHSFHPSHNHRKLAPAELQTLVPGPQLDNREFLLIDEQSLDPRDLCSALPIAARAAGVRILENMSVRAVGADGPFSPLEIQVGTANLTAAHFIDCSGAWTQFLYRAASCPPGVGVQAITPRKGQMLAVREPGPNRLAHVLRTPNIYLVPRGDGRIVIGATIEDAGFDKTVSSSAIAALLQTAAELYPPIAHAEIVETWAGLRPHSPDQLPLIGNYRLVWSDFPGRVQGPVHSSNWIATGHFRNGILLAPATARALSRLIRGLAPEIDLTPFDPRRFTPAAPVPSSATAHC